MPNTKPPLLTWIAFLLACTLSAICLAVALGCLVSFIFTSPLPIYIVGSILFGGLYKIFERAAFSLLGRS
jgi:hypothetical protein